MVILYLYRQKTEMGKEPVENDGEGLGTVNGLWAVEGILGHVPAGGIEHLLGFLEVPLWQAQTIHFNFRQ